MNNKEIFDGCKIIVRFMYPDWQPPTNMKELPAKSIVNNDLFVYAMLLAEEYEKLGYNNDWNAFMPVYNIITNKMTSPNETKTPIWHAYHNMIHRVQDVNITEAFKELVNYIKAWNDKQITDWNDYPFSKK